MAADIHLEDAEEKYQEDLKESIAHDAAIFVQNGYSEADAIAKAKEVSTNQQAAANDSTGVLATLAEAQSPKQPEGKEAQTKAIASRLIEKLD